MSATLEQQFIEYIVKSLVGNPDSVSIDRTVDEKGVLLMLTVHPDDLGRVIGKRGVTAQSLRTLLRALGTKNSERFNLKIVDNGEYSSNYPDDASTNEQSNNSEVSSSETFERNSTDVAENMAKTSNDFSDESEVVRRTRAELADLDDLDI